MQVVTRRIFISIGCIAAFLGGWLSSAHAEPSVQVGGEGDTLIGNAQQRVDDRRHRPSTPSNSSDAVTPPKTSVYQSALRWSPEQQTVCLDVMQVEGEIDSFLNVNQELAAYEFGLATPVCYLSQLPPTTLSPGAAAQMVWRDQMKLPPPQPYIAPGKAITGLRAFLEIRGPRTATQSFNVFGYALTINATATSYDVDWGDGSWSRGLTSSGGPWPHGDVRHVYTTQGTYTVRVLERWAGTWSVAGGGGGSVDGALSCEGRIDAFPVVQVQAVRNR